MKNLKRVISQFFLFLAYLWSCYIFKRRNHLRVIGRENIPSGTGNLFLSKHESSLDSAALAAALFSWREYAFDYKRVPWNTPKNQHVDGNLFRKIIFNFLKTVIIIRGSNSNETRQKQVLAMVKTVEDSNSLVFFEGTRGEGVGPCKRGVAQVIQLAKPRQVIPIFIRGTKDLLPTGVDFSLTKVASKKEITIVIGKNIIFSDLNNLTKIREEVRQAVIELERKI